MLKLFPVVRNRVLVLVLLMNSLLLKIVLGLGASLILTIHGTVWIWFGRQVLFKQLEKRYCALLKERENPPPRKPSSIVSGTKIASTFASKDRTHSQSRASSSKS